MKTSVEALVECGIPTLEILHRMHEFYPSRHTLCMFLGGISSDWYYDGTEAIYTFTYELRPRSGSDNGFILDPKFIIPTAEEVWAGVVAATKATLKQS